MGIEIRLNQVEDYVGLMEIENSVWNDENTPFVHVYENVIEYQLRYPVGSMLVAVDGKEVLGLVNFNNPSPLARHSETWLLGIGVANQAQGRGVGQKLLEALKAKAREEGIHKLSLRVMGTNLGAQRFYLRNGFEIEGNLKEEFKIGDKYVDDIFMGFIL